MIRNDILGGNTKNVVSIGRNLYLYHAKFTLPMNASAHAFTIAVKYMCTCICNFREIHVNMHLKCNCILNKHSWCIGNAPLMYSKAPHCMHFLVFLSKKRFSKMQLHTHFKLSKMQLHVRLRNCVFFRLQKTPDSVLYS